MSLRFTSIFFLLFCSLITIKSFATHLRAGEITAERISCSSLTFRITITVFIDSESGVQFGGESWLEFGDGERVFVPETQTIPRPDLGDNMGTASFTIVHTYSGYGNYIIGYSETNRNNFVVNMDGSGDTKFYIETGIYLDPFFSCNQNLPELLIYPIDRACKGVAFFHNPGAFDLDGDSLSFEMVVPQQSTNTPVFNYKDPNDSKFYSNFNAGNEEQKDKPVFSIDPVDGTLIWDAPGMIGEYNIAFHIIEWRKDRAGMWRKMSYIRRDMQITVEDCKNERPDLIVPNDTCVIAGTILEKFFFGIDFENDQVKIEVFSEVLNLFVSPATFSPDPPSFQSSSPAAQLNFRWSTQCEHVKEQYYTVVFKISDNPADGPKLVTFKTWRIKVVGPPPQWNDIQLDFPKRHATLTWDNYVCENAMKMQVWRKIDGFNYTPATCETGMPGFLGYSLIAAVDLDQGNNPVVNQFVDTNNEKGLAPGAKYCYRLVAIFPEYKGGESYVSKDTCLIPIPADVPVITNVTVEETHSMDGAIRISWRSPFEIDKKLFPGPYEYEVLRAKGFTGNDYVSATPTRLRDTTFVDTGINTNDLAYNYRIALYSKSPGNGSGYILIDSSAAASSVRLEATASHNEIALSWKAVVPWSNTSEVFPSHLIYRRTGENSFDPFELIDSVSVLSENFAYLDRGEYKKTKLDKTKTYCYRVLTRGVYGNPLIQEPLENFSQIICLKPDDGIKPCAPVLSLAHVDCNEVFASTQCTVTDFSNTLYWNIDCKEDVRSYRIYAASDPNKDFFLLADNVRDTFYIDKNLPSFARCYAVKAVDRHGEESDWSEFICSDNCPYFELPNVFTPNGDDCNEYFSAYGPFSPLNQNIPESCTFGVVNYSKCLRFVTQVSFSVYNRWGKEVYHFKSGPAENSTYINWNGKGNEGQILSSGVYYYIANVTFDTLDPRKQKQAFKGWVQLLR